MLVSTIGFKVGPLTLSTPSLFFSSLAPLWDLIVWMVNMENYQNERIRNAFFTY